MSQIFNRDVAVSIAVNTMEFFQWCTGLKTREEIEEELNSVSVVGDPEYDGREELAKLLDSEQMTITSYFRTEQDIELTINDGLSFVVEDPCPFMADLK